MAAESRADVGPMVPALHRVVSRHQELHDTCTLALESVGVDPVRPAAGQFNMLWAFGVGEAPISVSGFGPNGEVLHTVRSIGAVTAALCALEPGDAVGLRGPYGAGWDVESARGGDVLVVAGGLGIAPVRPIVTEVLAERDAFERVVLLFGARSPDELLYTDELLEWAERRDVDVGITVDSADPSWRGEVGVVTKLIDRVDPFESANATAFVCGPEIMMRFAAQSAIERGLSPERTYLSMERNMHCAIGHCGHCQLGPMFVCKDGPVVPWPVIEPLMKVRQR